MTLRRWWCLSLLVPVCAGLTLSCGGSGLVLETTDAGAEAGGDAASADATEDVQDASNAGFQKLGVITVTSANSPDAGPPYAAYHATATVESSVPASYVAGVLRGVTQYCTSAHDGACEVDDCPIPNPHPILDAGTLLPVGDGTVQITGGKPSVQMFAAGSPPLDPTVWFYPDVSGSQSLWAGGEELEAFGAGADAPSFDLKVAAPDYVTVYEPAWSDGGDTLSLDRSVPFQVGWYGGGDGKLEVNIQAFAADGSRTVLIDCAFAPTDHTASIGTSVLSKLPSPNLTPQSTLAIVESSFATTQVADWTFAFRAQAMAIVPNAHNGVAVAQLTIQ